MLQPPQMKVFYRLLLAIFFALPAYAQTLPVDRNTLNNFNNSNFFANGKGYITGPLVNSSNAYLIASLGFLQDSNTWTQQNIFNINPQLPACVGYPYSTGSAPFACATTIPGNVVGLGSAVVYADIQPGSDMGAKINAAKALLPSTGGVIDARGLTGNQTLSTAVTLTNTQLILRAVTLGQYATITLGNTSSLTCQPNGFGQGNNFGPSILKQANGANLQNLLLVSGGQSAVSYCVFDGNKTNNPSAGPVVAVSGGHFLLDKLTVQNGVSDGIMIYSGPSQGTSGTTAYSYGTANNACCGTIRDVMSISNNGDGYNCGGTADVIFEGSQAEGNGGDSGLELNNCPAWRLSAFDFGTNQIGIHSHGAAYSAGVSLGAYGTIIGVGQFGGQYKQDIFFDGTSGASYQNQVTGAQFLGSQNRADATYPVIEQLNSSLGGSAYTGLVINGGLTGSTNRPTNFIYIHGTSGTDSITGVSSLGYLSSVGFNVPNQTSFANACDTSIGVCETSGRLYGATTSSVALNSTAYFGPAGADAYGAIGSSWWMQNACVVVGFSVSLGNAPGSAQNEVYTLLDNGTSTGITATVSGASTFTVSASGYYNVAAGHLLSLQEVGTATAATGQIRYTVQTRCGS